MNTTKITTEFGDALSTAINNKENNIESFVWKDKNGKETRLVDMPVDDLQRIYTHARDMIYNQNKYTPGGIKKKANIRTLIEHCNAELMKRYLMYDLNIDLFKLPINIVQYINDHIKNCNLNPLDTISTIFTGLPVEYSTITLSDLRDACLDGLSIVNRKMIPEQFILNQGIWLTDKEKEDLTEYDDNKVMRPWKDVIKERLLINGNLRYDPRGFTFNELRLLVHLKDLSKISSLPSETLRLLRDKVFLLLDADTDYHIKKWETIVNNIEKVADYKHVTLTKKEY